MIQYSNIPGRISEGHIVKFDCHSALLFVVNKKVFYAVREFILQGWARVADSIRCCKS